MPETTTLLSLIIIALLVGILYTLKRMLMLERRITAMENNILKKVKRRKK